MAWRARLAGHRDHRERLQHRPVRNQTLWYGDTLYRVSRLYQGNKACTYVFNEAPHARPSYTTSTEDLDSIPCRLLRSLGRVHLEQGDWSGELLRLLFVRLHCIEYRTCTIPAKIGRTMLFIWCVMFSNQLCTASTRAIIAATLLRMTACDARGFPNALR